jgi:hypothetical protein
MNVTKWHQAGERGKGVRVAILDTGWAGYRDHLGQALPRTVVARSFRPDGRLEARASQHGILCAEVIHAIAPEAELYLLTWDVDRPGTFLDAVRWARQQKVQIISCSVIMPTWSDNEGNGNAHRELAGLLGEQGLFFAAAGNTAERHWQGTFTPDAEQWHLWARGIRDNRLVPWEYERVSVEMMWRGNARYRLEVVDYDSGEAVAVANETRDSHHSWAAARFVPQAGRIYGVRVRKLSGSAGRFHLVVLGGTLDRTEARGSVSFPADGPEVIAVGAVTADSSREPYSACGIGNEQTKPDLVATVPFPSTWRERPFTGTSASAPQAAGLAALTWGRNPTWSAGQVREHLAQSARRLSEKVHNPETGFGQIQLPSLLTPRR